MRRYLLVDDTVELAENYAEILRDAGDEADVTGEPTRALELLRLHRYDALVTDMRMPGMGGADLVEAARRLDPVLPIVLMTAYSDEADLDRVHACGVWCVLHKPVHAIRFMEEVEAACRGVRL